MGKILIKSFIAAALIATAGVSAVSAADGIKSPTFNSNKVILDEYDAALNLGGQRMISVVKDGEVNASNYMPVRGVLQAMGYTVDWDAQKQAVILTSPQKGFKPEPKPDMSETIAPTQDLLSGCWNAVVFGYDGYSTNGEVLKFYFSGSGKIFWYGERWGESYYIGGTYSIDKDIINIKMTYSEYYGEPTTLSDEEAEAVAIQCRFSKDGGRMHLINVDDTDTIITFSKDDGAEFVGKVEGLKTKGIKSAAFNTNKVILDGKELDLGGQKMISVVKEGEINASNYMPVRGVLEAIGYTVDWDGEQKAVIVSVSIPKPAPIPNTDGTIAPTKELLNGYWSAIDFKFGDNTYYDYSYENDVVKYYFDMNGKFGYYAEFDGRNGYVGGTYTINNDTLSLIATYVTYVDYDGEQVTETDEKTPIIIQCRFSKDGSKMFAHDVDYDDVHITFTKDNGAEFKKYQ